MRGTEILNIFISLLWERDKARLSVPPLFGTMLREYCAKYLNTRFSSSNAVCHPAICGIQRKAKIKSECYI